MKNMSIKNKILTIVTISIVLTFLTSLVILTLESKKLANTQKDDFSKLVYTSSKDELKAYAQLAESSIKSFYFKSTKESILKES